MLMSSRFSYKKLKKDPSLYKDEDEEQQQPPQQSRAQRSRRIRLRRRWWRIRVPRLGKIFNRRKFVWAKIVRRLKESQTHFSDLFSGNYLFLQVTPESLKLRSKAYLPPQSYLKYMPASAKAGW